MAENRAKAYTDQLAALTRQADALTPEARARILALLEAMHRELLADIARSDPSSYNAARIAALKQQVDRLLAQFGHQASAQIEKAQASAYQGSANAINATVAAATDTIAVHPVLDQAVLQVVQGYTADLITGLSRDAAAKINAAIQRAYLGGSNLQQLVTQIGTVLEDGRFSGLFSQVGERATMIATNEILRVNSLASMARINELAKQHPDLQKMWRHTPVAKIPRPSHILADGQVRKPGEPFLVNGEELQYPRDPSGTAANTINCHCLVIPSFPESSLKPTEEDKARLRHYGISVSAG